MTSDWLGKEKPPSNSVPRGISCGKGRISGPQTSCASEARTSPAPSALIMGTTRLELRTGR